MDFEPSRSLPRCRFGQLSKNMFFTRHVAQPRFLRFITGASGQRVCHVREQPLALPISTTGDPTKSLMSDPRFCIDFAPQSYNETLLRSYANKIEPKKRRERLLPPMPGWNPTGTVKFSIRIIANDFSLIVYSFSFFLVVDTDNWRRELARIAEMVGFVTSDDLVELENRKETPVTLPQISATTPAPVPVLTTPLPASASKRPKSSGQYSRQSGRWNETPKSANRIRSASGRRTPFKSYLPNHLVCVDEQEREMWMIQVLCQILKTDNINEIQSWLVSSGPNEKEAVRQLITIAIKGLEENGRIQKQDRLNGNVKEIQVNMDSFGSLLANRFPYVSSTMLIVPSNENSSRPLSRPRTAPATQATAAQSKADFHSKSVGGLQHNLETTDENSELMLTMTESIVLEPTPIDVKHDIQILTLDDNDNDNDNDKSQPTINEENEKIPF
ncbi:unnamed protein product [Rotaria magnacalcarata]|uniref:Uncharacterized protein n=2 Tax=Rotaria magnacalcarata TaxID=392030 RepID=A0A814WQ23_9BILA|nr:unnamed protein product [Rotaria magnacalcarata]CAF1591427.1 unnamed protein product [Rotaria magnacalcarata]CAF2147903.1 unnamed protein product [Rotaria magnacalcarata]